MTAMFITALIMGAIGTFHCIGMCGPLAISLPVVQANPGSRFFAALLYNLGRVFTYATLGAVFGIAGTGFVLLGYQQLLSISLGVLILIFIFIPGRLLKNKNSFSAFFEKLRQWLASFFSKRSYHSVFFIGILNGLLPCGLVYIALASAISTGSVTGSSLFMAGFGLGTLPVMWAVAFFGSIAGIGMRNKIRKAYPYVMCIIGVLLIVRGLGLSVPYLSPPTNPPGVALHAIGCHD